MQIRFMTSLLGPGFLLCALLFFLGPGRIADRYTESTPSVGQRLPENPRFASERNFFRYTSTKNQLSRDEVARRLVSRFGISVDAIFNANTQREAQVLKPDVDNHIRIPLTQKQNP